MQTHVSRRYEKFQELATQALSLENLLVFNRQQSFIELHV